MISENQIQEISKQQAEKVYDQKGTRFGVADVPTHSHDGIDSNQLNSQVSIELKNKNLTNIVITPPSATTTFYGFNVKSLQKISSLGFAADNAVTTFNLDEPTEGGETSAFLTSNWLGISGARITIFGDETRLVNFTNGSDEITWEGALENSGVSTITVGILIRAHINGEAHFGRCFLMGNLDSDIATVETIPAGEPFIQAFNAIKVNSSNSYDYSVQAIPGFICGLLQPFTATGSILKGATSATLSSAWPYASGAITLRFSNGDIRRATVTLGNTAISWIEGLSSNATSAFVAVIAGFRIISYTENSLTIEDSITANFSLNATLILT